MLRQNVAKSISSVFDWRRRTNDLFKVLQEISHDHNNEIFFLVSKCDFFCIPQNKYLQIKISSMNCGNELPKVCMFQRNLDFAPLDIQFNWLQMETDQNNLSSF